jgi:hypothetical protein
MKKINLFLLAIAVTAAGCQDNKRQDAENEEVTEMDTREMENSQTEDDWQVLFDGENLDHWKAFNSDSITQWQVEGDALVFTPSQGEREGSENIITKDTYTNFELSLEWKISENGNSGIMWAVQEGEEYNEPYITGPEIQVLDNQGHPDAQNGPIRQAGALYDLSEPSEDVTRPAEEWNEMTIMINYDENRGLVTLNGQQVNEFPLQGEEWDQFVENSKFSDWEDFGQHKTGHIALQDHGDKVWYRNIKIRELE